MTLSHRFKYLVMLIGVVALRCSIVMLLVLPTNANVYHTLALLRTIICHYFNALTFNSVAVRLVVVYRPPKSNESCFIQEFSEYLELLSASTGKLLIMGDFNIHVDRPDLPVVAKFLSTLVIFGLNQHVVDATHIDGHTLDLVITRCSDDFIYDSFVSDLISDHFAVISVVRAHKPLLLKKKSCIGVFLRSTPMNWQVIFLNLLLYVSLHHQLTDFSYSMRRQ